MTDMHYSAVVCPDCAATATLSWEPRPAGRPVVSGVARGYDCPSGCQPGRDVLDLLVKQIINS